MDFPNERDKKSPQYSAPHVEQRFAVTTASSADFFFVINMHIHSILHLFHQIQFIGFISFLNVSILNNQEPLGVLQS